MNIQSRFEYKDKVGYVVEENGLEYPILGKGLYDEEIVHKLIASGYKYLNYHGSVLDPTGIDISSYAATAYEISEDDYLMFLDMEDDALSEQDMARYFENITEYSSIEFRQPKTVEIKTREELIEYLEKVKLMKFVSKVSMDVRPLNSFVARDALFTVEEISNDSNIRDLYKVVSGRREFYSVTDYKRLIKFLKDEELLKDNYTYGDLLQAYNAWGPCGIKTDVINQKINLTSSTDIIDTARISNMEDMEKCLLSRDNIVFYSGGQYDFSEVEDFTGLPVRPVNIEEYRDIYQARNTWKTEYMITDCYVTKVRPVISYDMITADGLIVYYKMDDQHVVISDTHRHVYHDAAFMIRCYDDSLWSVAKICNDNSYAIWNFAIAKAKSLFKENTIVPPFTNSYDLIINEGVSPEVAVRYIARRIQDDEALNESYQNGVNYSRAHEYYKNGPEENIVTKYNPEGLPYETTDELIEIMLNTRDAQIANNSYLQVDRNDFSASGAAVQSEIKQRPLENLEFVKMAKEGEIIIDYLAAGIGADGAENIATIAKLLIVLCRISNNGEEVSPDMIGEQLSRIEENNYVNIYDLIGERTEAFRGYLKDKAFLNATRAQQCTSAIYVTKIFNEISNKPIDQQRHYMMEVIRIAMSKNSIEEKEMFSIGNQIREQMKQQRQYPKMIRESISMESYAIAIKVMYKIALKQANLTQYGDMLRMVELIPAGEEFIEVPILINKEFREVVTMPGYFQPKYISLYDWCDFEMGGNGAFNFYCVNANINPWRVIPKEGLSIPVYNFTLNYIKPQIINGMSEATRTRIAELGARVVCLSSDGIDNALLPYTVDALMDEYDETNIDAVLNANVEETVDNYFNRFSIYNSKASDGIYVVELPLKSDAIYGGYASSVDEVTYSEVVHGTSTDDMVRYGYLRNYEPTVAGARKVLADNRQIVNKFDIDSYDFDHVCRWHMLVTGQFNPKGICILIGNNLTIITQNGKAKINLEELKEADAEALVKKEIFYKLKPETYMFESSGNKYVVEVR